MPKHRFVYLLSRARHALMRRLDEEALAACGITSVQLGALFALEKNDGCQLSELATTLGLDGSAVTGLARRLEQAGVVTRQRCESDRRSWRLYLSARGREVLQLGHQSMREVNERITEGLSEAELDIAAGFLKNIIRTFQT